jgi:hypothetical protein
MSTVIHARVARALVLLTLATVVASSLAGCASSLPGPVQTSGTATATVGGSKPVTTKATALTFVGKATEAVKAVTPGAVLVGVQTPAPTMVQPPAKWDYLYGDAKRNKIIVIEMSADTAGAPTDAGNSKLTSKEYARVAPVSEWKVDSDAALAAATVLYKKQYKNDPPGGVSMGLVLIRPENTKAVGAKALQWEVYYFPANGDTNKAIRISVDAVTGKAFLPPTGKT